jgi:transglycosylase-like protein with SLT domain
MAGSGVSLPALVAAGAGALFLWSGIKGGSVTRSLRSLLSAKPHLDTTVANPVTGSGSAPGGTVTPSGGGPSAVSSQANQATGRLMAASYGWGAGQEWTALNNVVMSESGWSSTAQNPTSTAYGIFQFLDTTWASVGYTKTSDPVVQIAAGLAYIRQRYGDPVRAWAFHQANGWY